MITVAGAFFAIWLLIRYFLPLAAPFLLGWFFAFLAEPLTSFLVRRMHLHRGVASGFSVSVVLVFLLGIVFVFAALCYRELTILASEVPEYAEMLGSRIGSVRNWAVNFAGKLPGSLGQNLSGTVGDLFSGSGVVLEKVASGAISVAGNLAGRLPGGAVTMGTAVISAYLIGGQYLSLGRRLTEQEWVRRSLLPMLSRIRDTVKSWFRAQLKLSVMTFGIVTAGFLLLWVEQPVLWGAVTAVVDAIPILGTGTVLLPMALISFLWGEKVRGIGLVALYVTAVLSRSALEPRLVGRQLGMNPLVTLMALYVGFRLWGVTGMILSPILAVTVQQITVR